MQKLLANQARRIDPAGDRRGEEMSDTLVQIRRETPADVLAVKTFGGFSISFNGSEISFGQQSDSQIVHLLQLLLHFREEGVSRELAKSVLFGEKEIEDVSHSIRNIIYNLRKKLKESGLPESQFVIKRSGSYYWADDIPVDEDAYGFEQSYRDAMSAETDEEKLELLIQTIYRYTGKFLAGNRPAAWSAREADRYRTIFAGAMNEAAEIMRRTHQFQLMYDLGLYAARVDPFSEWEILMLEALAGLGRFDVTENFYKETVDAYTAEFGNKNTTYIRDFINRIGLKLVMGHETLEEIQAKLRSSGSHENNGYYCSLPVFQEIYRLTERMFDRAGDRIYLMLCTIMDGKGSPLLNGSRLEDLADRLKAAIVASVRYTDTVTRYGKGQYLILLINTTYEDCSKIANRINKHFLRAGQRTSVNYTVSNIIVTAFSDEGSELIVK